MTQRTLMRDAIVLTMDPAIDVRRTSCWSTAGSSRPQANWSTSTVHAVADELAESADGLLRRSGARSILLSSCRGS